MFQRILAAYDGSNVARQALQEAVKLAKDQHAQLRIVSVVDLGPLYWMPISGFNVAEIEQAMVQQTQTELNDAAALARQEGIATDTALRRADGQRVSEEIIAEAKSWPADLNVLESRTSQHLDGTAQARARPPSLPDAGCDRKSAATFSLSVRCA